MRAQDRTILHVDMDAFFASVEQRDHPELRGKPVLVGGTGDRGVVAAASYEARAYGCRSAMPMTLARRLCPQAIIVKGSYSRYQAVSEQISDIFRQFTDQIQPLSIDEAFLDVTGSLVLFGSGEKIAQEIRSRIRSQIRLTASIGVATNKFLAKLASDLSKPDGLMVIHPEMVEKVLPSLAVDRIWGIGTKTAQRLYRLGIKTVHDLRKMDDNWLAAHFGSYSHRIRELIYGIDHQPVHAPDPPKSIGQQQTFPEDLLTQQDIRNVLLEQAQSVGGRLRQAGYLAQCVTVKIRLGNFRTITRSRKLISATSSSKKIYELSCRLFDEWALVHFQPVRLIGTQTSEFTREVQLELFDPNEQFKQEKVDRTLDVIRNRFGERIIRRAHDGKTIPGIMK